MSKMSDMAMTIEELHSAAAAINEAANWLAEQFGGTADSAPVENVRAVLAEKSRTGHTTAIRRLLQKYGASKLSAVDPKHYEALLKDAEVLDDAT